MHVSCVLRSAPVCSSALSDSSRLHCVKSREPLEISFPEIDSPMPPPSQNAVRTWRLPDHSLPSEILSIIFLLIVDDSFSRNRVRLMLVCRRWYAIMISTPGIPSRLRIDESTTVERVLAAIQGARWCLHVTIDPVYESIGQDFNADAFDACCMAAIEAASRWRALHIYSIPQSRKFKAFQIVPPLKILEDLWLGQGCDRGGFFEPIMTTIATTAARHLTNMNLANLNAVLYLVQPDCHHVFCSLTSLTIELPKRMERPANILPHLQRLEIFVARHLYLPIYPPNAPLPLTQTLRNLQLKSVSVQWMAGRVFPVLELCFITFPLQFDSMCLHPVTMSACTCLSYDSNDLDPLRYFHDLPLADLSVTSGQWNVTRGNLQLIILYHMVVPHARNLTGLYLDVRCSEQLLVYILSLLPALGVLKLRLASPRALSETFFQAFVATKSNADSPYKIGALPRLPRLPLCLNLVKLKLYYKRWLRGPERTALLLVFGDIVSSRQSEGAFELHLRCDYSGWLVLRHVESIHVEVSEYGELLLGIPSQRGIIPLVLIKGVPFLEAPFREAEYLVAGRQLYIGFLLTLHHLVELRVGDKKDRLPSEPPANLPLFHTLRVLEARKIHHSFLAGQTFYKLERCRMSLHGEVPKSSEDRVTQMPVCTSLDVDNLTLLATLKLPQIYELSVSFDHPEFNAIWETHVAMNANLSGLELLHVYGWYREADLIQALRCLPALKVLILANCSDLDAAFFEKFVPTHPNGTAGLVQSRHEGQVSEILCPMLRSLLIEECGATERVEELIPVLKQVVTLRSAYGSPLERFNLVSIEFGRKFELIGSEGGFVAETKSLDENIEPFKLDI